MASTISFDVVAHDLASKTFDKINGAADKTEGRFSKVSRASSAAGKVLAGGLAAAGVAAVAFTKKAAEDEQSASRLSQTLHKAAGATDAQVASVERWITAQGKAKGVADDDLRPALSKLAVATGSVSKAQKLASLAMDISAGTGKSLESVSFALAKAQNGNVAGLSRLGVKTQSTTKDTVALQKAQISARTAQAAYTTAVKEHGRHSTEASLAAAKLKVANENVGAAQEKTKKTTLSLDQITKELSSQYGGAAARNAETAAGKQKILTVQMSELQEQIGYKLLPVMLKLTNVGLKVVNWISHNTTTVGVLIGVLGGLVAAVASINAVMKVYNAVAAIATLRTAAQTEGTVAYAIATKVQAAASKAAAAGQWLLNAAMEANPIGLVVIALAALAAGLIYAYKHSETFRNIVNGAFHAVASTAIGVFNGIRKVVSSVFDWIKGHWKLLAAVLGGPIVAAAIVIISNWGKIKSAASTTVGAIKSAWSRVRDAIVTPIANAVQAVAGLWVKISQAEANAVGKVVDVAKGIPGKVKAAVGNLGSILVGAGRAIIQGLLDGIQDMVGALQSKLHSITDMIPIHKGPEDKDRELLRPAGRAIMDGLLKGLSDRELPLQKALSRVTDLIQGVGSKITNLQGTRSGFLGTFTADSVFGTDLSEGGGIDALLSAQEAQAKQARRLNRDIKALTTGRGPHLSKDLIRQLQSQGTSGAAALHALASGDPAQIRRLNALNAQTNQSLRAAGMRAGNFVRGGSINDDLRRARKQEHVLELLEHHLKDLAETQKKDQTIVVKIGDDAIIKAIRRYEHRKGKKTSV